MDCLGCDWDPQKNVSNHTRHKVWFEDTCCVFNDPFMREEPDEGDYDEDRWRAIGEVEPVIMVVIYTERNGVQRIISARKAENHERRAYRNG